VATISFLLIQAHLHRRQQASPGRTTGAPV
jgi:hypothetical protein